MLQDIWLFIINPVGGNGAVKRHWPAFERLLVKSEVSFHLEWTQSPGHAILLVKEKIIEGYRKIVAVGGDGTANEVVNGICAQNKVDLKEILFTLLPIGTGNDWKRTWNIPIEFDAWLNMLRNGKMEKQSIGVVKWVHQEDHKKRYFINVAGMAYDAFVVQYSEDFKMLINNRFFYLYLVLKCLFKFRLPKASIRFKNRTITDNFYTINLGICRYSGGGMQLVPHAVPNDDKMALTYAGKVPKWYIILNTWRFYNGSLTKMKRIHSDSVVSLALLDCDTNIMGIEVDGEFIGYGPAKFTLFDSKLRIVIP